VWRVRAGLMRLGAVIPINARPNIRLEYLAIESAVLQDYRHFYSNAIPQKKQLKIFSIFLFILL